MVNWVRTLVGVSRARNAAVATIQPLVEASRLRLNGISDAVWLEPYMVGFLTMLITITARNQMPSIESQAMCKVQAGAWQAITGLNFQVGEEIILLSESHDPQFASGCSDAVMMAAEFCMHAASLDCDNHRTSFDYAGNDDGALTGGIALQASRSQRWREVFDAYVERRR